MSQPVQIFDDTAGAQPILVRLNADLEAALNISSEIAVKAVKVQGGMLLVDHFDGDTLTRWLLPPTAFRWVKQVVALQPTPRPPDES